MGLPPGGREQNRGHPAPGPGFASGGPAFGRPKVGGKTAGETPDPRCLSNRSVSDLIPDSH